jgi:hypothetical protein
MQEVRQKIITKFNEKFSFEVLNGFAMRELYLLYDKHAFYNQLSERLVQLNQLNAYKTTLSFNESLILPEDAQKYCGVSSYFNEDPRNNTYFNEGNSVKVINIRISPWIIGRITNLNKDQLFASFHTRDVNVVLLLAFEHELTHLIFCLWEREESITVHSDLFNCVHDAFFNDNTYRLKGLPIDIVNALTTHNSYPSPSKFLEHAVYSYDSNSCYIDSLLTVIFFSKSDVLRNALFTTNVDRINYSNIPCESKKNVTEFVYFVQKLQSELFREYMELINNEKATKNNTVCTDIRTLLQECYPDVRKKSGWQIYSAPEIYDLFAYMFPQLSYIYPVIVNNKNKLSTTPKSMFTFWEYMEPPDYATKSVLWDDFDSDIIVFRNGGIPAVRKYGVTKAEIVKVPSYKDGKRVMTKETVYKSRVFGEYIINDRYEMVGAIVLHGTTPGKSGGSHYTAYVKVREGINNDDLETKHARKRAGSELACDVWMEYNDIGSVWRLTGDIHTTKDVRNDSLGKFPESILVEKGGIKPEMYFYAKVKWIPVKT